MPLNLWITIKIIVGENAVNIISTYRDSMTELDNVEELISVNVSLACSILQLLEIVL